MTLVRRRTSSSERSNKLDDRRRRRRRGKYLRCTHSAGRSSARQAAALGVRPFELGDQLAQTSFGFHWVGRVVQDGPVLTFDGLAEFSALWQLGDKVAESVD